MASFDLGSVYAGTLPKANLLPPKLTAKAHIWAKVTQSHAIMPPAKLRVAHLWQPVYAAGMNTSDDLDIFLVAAAALDQSDLTSVGEPFEVVYRGLVKIYNFRQREDALVDVQN